MPVFGTSQSQREELDSAAQIFDDVIELVVGSNVHRVIQGPQKTNIVFYPTIIETEEEGVKKVKPGHRALQFLEVPQLIHSIQAAENDIRQKLSDKGEIGFKIQTRWWYLAINTLDKTDIKVKPVRYPKSIKDDITEMETKLDVKDPTCLLNGHYFLYDILIEKKVDPKKAKKYGTSYKATVYGNNPFQSRVPAKWLREDAGKVIESCDGMEAVFPQELIQAIENCDIVLEKILEPMSEIEVKERLQKFPINLLGRRPNTGAFTYPQSPDFKEMIEALGLPTVSLDISEEGSNVAQPVEGQSGVELKKPEEALKEPAPSEAIKEIEKSAEQVDSGGLSGIKPLPKEENKPGKLTNLKGEGEQW